MARHRVVGLIRPAERRAAVREQLAGAGISPGIRTRVERREPSSDDWLRAAAWEVRGEGRAPRWRA